MLLQFFERKRSNGTQSLLIPTVRKKAGFQLETSLLAENTGDWHKEKDLSLRQDKR